MDQLDIFKEKKVVIIDYGAGNIFSVQKALERCGIEPLLSSSKEEIQAASHVVFPGVGHAKNAMEQLKSSGLNELIPTLKMPVLGICLGMQLMCKSTEEGNVQGLGIFNTKVKQFTKDVQVPHMGWNEVAFCKNQLSGAYYFVHSYFAETCEHSFGEAFYPNSFAASLRKDNFWGVQFHPEKSGVLGEQLIQTFLAL
jgi:imidazole glycerol-phosphate synthase subunit HisH